MVQDALPLFLGFGGNDKSLESSMLVFDGYTTIG